MEELGFPGWEAPDNPILQMEPYVKLFGIVVHARIQFLSDFDKVVVMNVDNKEYLRRLQAACRSRGREFIAVPEDILSLLVLKHGGEFLTQRYVREVLQFEPRIGEAVIDCLGIPA